MKSKRDIKISQRAAKIMAVCFLMTGWLLMLAACGAGKEQTGAQVRISKEGTVSTHIVENFDKVYYDVEELTQMILSEAASYNRQNGSGRITVKRVEAENGIATVDMIYENPADYAAFNEEIFFIGTVQAAKEAGYDLNTVLASVKDPLDTVGMSDMLAMEGVRILITDMKDPVTLNGKALFVSENVSVDKKFKTVSFDKESQELAYIIYK